MPIFADPVLDVGDRVRIVCPSHPELCVVRTVGPDGTLDIPQVGAIPAATKTTGDVARRILDWAQSDLLPPVVRVGLLRRSPDEVRIQGAVKNPLRIFAPKGIDFSRLMAAADALPEADLLLLPRTSRIRPGTAVDVPVVSSERKIRVLGAVQAPNELPPGGASTLSDAVDAAGGFSAHADRTKIVVVRGGESIPASFPEDAKFKILPGDIVRVGLSADRHYVTVKGLVARPGTIEFASGMTVLRALKSAGEMLPKAKNGTLVWQTGPKTYRLSIAFLLQGRIPDPVLGPEDTLVVEEGRP